MGAIPYRVTGASCSRGPGRRSPSGRLILQRQDKSEYQAKDLPKRGGFPLFAPEGQRNIAAGEVRQRRTEPVAGETPKNLPPRRGGGVLKEGFPALSYLGRESNTFARSMGAIFPRRPGDNDSVPVSAQYQQPDVRDCKLVASSSHSPAFLANRHVSGRAGGGDHVNSRTNTPALQTCEEVMFALSCTWRIIGSSALEHDL